MQTYVGYYTHASKLEWLRRVVPRMPRTMALLCCLAVASAAQAATVQLEPLADNWISSCSTGCTVNYGDMDELRVRVGATARAPSEPSCDSILPNQPAQPLRGPC